MSMSRPRTKIQELNNGTTLKESEITLLYTDGQDSSIGH